MKENKTIQRVGHDKCTGCSACFNICPKEAITMKEDRDGFLYPVVDGEKCVSCGLCLRTCPSLHLNYENVPSPACYAVMAPDEIRRGSSSGGVFPLLADWIIDQGGAVYGAAFTDSYHRCEHVCAETKEELDPLKGSKYVQSSIGESYKSVKKKLEAGENILFTGTPCQIAGLKAYLGREYVHLYTVDLVCHGTPPPEPVQAFYRGNRAGI